MRKLDRLFEIIQLLRGQRLRTAEMIASQLGVSTRTIYRDIQALMASGLPIEGERGIGYVIRQPITLPPLPFNLAELQAISVGLGMVEGLTDRHLQNAAHEARFKIAAVIPEAKSVKQESIHIYTPPPPSDDHLFSQLHYAIDNRYICQITYTAQNGAKTIREIQPLGLEYWGHVWTVACWCLLRNDFRAFRIDSITSLTRADRQFISHPDRDYTRYKSLNL